jgi:hypothetical protein
VEEGGGEDLLPAPRFLATLSYALQYHSNTFHMLLWTNGLCL